MKKVAVYLPGVELRGDTVETGYGITVLEGLVDSPAPRIDAEARDYGHGDFGQDLIWGASRLITIAGTYFGDDQFGAGNVLKRLFGQHFEVVFELPSGTFRAEMYFSERVRWEPGGIDWADFELTLKADDPRLYGPRLSGSTGVPSSGAGLSDPILDPLQEAGGGNLARVSFTSSGTAPTEPVVTVRGGVSEGFELLHVEAGRVIRCVRPIPDGSFVRVDNSRGEVWIDDQSPLPSTYLPVAEWFQVGAGETCTIQLQPLGAVTGTPEMSVEFAEASW